MILWGFIMMLAGFLTCLVLFLSNLDLFARIGAHGFGSYVQIFFDEQNLNANKVIFVIALAALVLGVVLYFVARAKNKKVGEDNPVIPVKVKKFFRDTRGEFKKIVWPGLPTVVRNTIATLIMCALVGVIIVVIDLGLSALINLLLGL